MYIPTTTHVLPLVTISRDRMLPRPGELLVQEGDRVEATTLLARADTVARHYIYDLTQRLQVPAAEVENYVKVPPGEIVEKGAVLAVRPIMLGLSNLSVKAPVNGVMVDVVNGKLLFAAAGGGIELRAMFAGTVTNIVPEHGATIAVPGALVQGMWGSGRQSYGIMRAATTAPDQAINPSALDEGSKGMILVGGTADQKALRGAETVKVRGMVLGSVPASLISTLRALSYPVIITESFGGTTMSEAAWSLLSNHDGREAMIDGRPADRWTSHRPELIIPLPSPGSPPAPTEGGPLVVGRRVRVLRPPHQGAVGILQQLVERPQNLPSGLQAPGAYVELEGREAELIPLANLEVFE
ncbi:MAG: hypothetical protein HYZ49_07980 [Chloroflexi bacterium]|nr:hypothetical protein [Chloroflexota bacterium]